MSGKMKEEKKKKLTEKDGKNECFEIKTKPKLKYQQKVNHCEG